MGKTKDEQFVLCAYEAALHAAGGSEDLQIPLNKYAIGSKCGLAQRGVDAICKQLSRSNFVKRVSDTEIILTKQGEELAQTLLKG